MDVWPEIREPTKMMDDKVINTHSPNLSHWSVSFKLVGPHFDGISVIPTDFQIYGDIPESWQVQTSVCTTDSQE